MFFSKRMMSGVLAASAAWMTGCGGEHAAVKKAEDLPAVTVNVTEAAEATVAEEYVATGTVKARTTTVLSARVMGYLRELKPQAGEMVKAGDVVAILDAKEIETGVRQAEAARNEARSALPEADNAIAAAKAQLDLANSTFQRMKSLLDQKSITSQEFDEVAARQRMAQANHEMARARRQQLEQKIHQADEAVTQATIQRGYTTVTAPFAGIVVERKAEPGMLAAPGVPLLVIEQAGSYRLEAGVEESRLGRMRIGMPVKVELESSEQPLNGRVEEIAPALDAGSRTFTVKIGITGGGTLRSGMFGRARFAIGEKSALVVPWTALVEQGQVQKVFVVDGGVARGRMVTTGAKQGGTVELLSGLNKGEKLVAPVPAKLTDGGKVEVR
ncbi:MAG TPA: efflux RND transporter periplasmic adaptor subunit [Paludibaculum sp.]|jgi:RND family efflux transporter MFP subunit